MPFGPPSRFSLATIPPFHLAVALEETAPPLTGEAPVISSRPQRHYGASSPLLRKEESRRPEAASDFSFLNV